MASQRKKNQEKKSHIAETEKTLAIVANDINQTVGKALINGGMIGHGRKKAAEMLNRVCKFIDHSRAIMQKNQKDVTLVRNDRNKANDFLMGFSLYKEDIEKHVKRYKTDLDEDMGNAKAAISSLNLNDLKTLPVESDKNPQLKQIFLTLFELLYQEEPHEFKWKVFKDIALGSEAEDFQKRLAQFDFKQMDSGMAIKLKNAKDQSFDHWAANGSFIDLLTWCDWVYDGFNMSTLLSEKQKELENAENKKDEKTVLLKASEKFLEMNQKSNAIIEQNLKQLESIKTKLATVLHASDDKNVDADFERLSKIQEEMSKLGTLPFVLNR